MSLVPEFSRPVSIARLDRTPLVRTIEANAAERAALAERFGLKGIDRLEATVTLTRLGRDDVRLDAEMTAALEQICVVTLAPVPVRLDEAFSLVYRAGIDEDEADRLALENPDDEVVEPLDGDVIDIGEAVAQEMSLALDPYPRAEGVELPLEIEEMPMDEEAPKANPFSVLSGLKKGP